MYRNPVPRPPRALGVVEYLNAPTSIIFALVYCGVHVRETNRQGVGDCENHVVMWCNSVILLYRKFVKIKLLQSEGWWTCRAVSDRPGPLVLASFVLWDAIHPFVTCAKDIARTNEQNNGLTRQKLKNCSDLAGVLPSAYFRRFYHFDINKQYKWKH